MASDLVIGFMDLVAATILLVLMGCSMHIEKRRFRNGVYLIMAIFTYLLGFVTLSSIDDQFTRLFTVMAMIYLLLPIALLAVVVMLFWDTAWMLHKEGRGIVSLLPAAFGVFLFLFYIGLGMSGRFAKSHILIRVLIEIILMSGYFLAVEFLAFALYSILYLKLPKKMSCDYVIVHGAGLIRGHEVTKTLSSRIEEGVKVWKQVTEKNPNRVPVLLMSGGKGSDEEVSEAFAMAQYVRDHYPDFPQDKLMMEDQSTTTWENLTCSKDLTKSPREEKQPDYLFVTSNFHVFRTALMACRLHMKGDGVGSHTALYYLPAAFIREYAAIVVRYKYEFILFVVASTTLFTIVNHL